MDLSISSTVAASETTSCYEQGCCDPVSHDLEKVNSSLVARQFPESQDSGLTTEESTQNVTPRSQENWAQDVCDLQAMDTVLPLLTAA